MRFFSCFAQTGMRTLGGVLVAASLGLSPASAATSGDGHTVNLLSIQSQTGSYPNGRVLVQFEPRHTLDSGCTNDYWALLDPKDAQFENIYSQLVAARLSGREVEVSVQYRAGDPEPQFCRLIRVISH